MDSPSFSALVLVVVTVVVVRLLERQEYLWVKKLLQWIPPILFAYIIPAAVCAGFELNFQEDAIHQWSKAILIPLAILTIMASMSLKALRIVGIKPLLLFVFGSFVIAMLPALLLIGARLYFPTTAEGLIHQELWKGLIPIVGSWIGGSTSQLVLKEYVGTPETLFLSVLVLDNIIVNIWTLLMFQLIRQSGQLDAFLGLESIPPINMKPKETTKKKNGPLTLVVVFGVIGIVVFLPLSFLGVILVLSFLGLLLGHTLSFWKHPWCLELGTACIITVMAILGLKLNFGTFDLPLFFIAIILVWLVLQFLASFGMAYLLKVSMVWLPIASMANFGGISTAPAVTAAYDTKLMPHAIVLAILSMVTGTFWGILSAWILQYFL